MKNILVTALTVTAMSSAAFAGSISLDSRADFESQTNNDAAKAVGQTNYYRFNMQTLRIDGKGNFTDTTSFRLRYRLNSGTNAAQTNARDSLNNSIDFAFIQHKVMDNFAVQLGKFGTDIGGVEGMTAGPDLYFTSLAYDEQSPLRYATGVKGIYTIADQEIHLMATNQQVDADINGASAPSTGSKGATNGFSQNRNAFGVVYKGSFMDKMLMPVLSWHEDNVQSTDPTATGATAARAYDKKFDYYAAGLKFDMLPFFAEVDYLYNTYKSRTILDENDKSTSIVGTVGYKMTDNWIGKLKVESSELETAGAGGTSSKEKYNGYQAAFEYLPTADKNFRYHLAYVSRDTKPATGDTRNTQTVIAGVRLFADFLK